MPRHLIIGGGVAGVTAAQHLRESDSAAGITLLAEEAFPYYYRPRLWEYLAGQIKQPALLFRPVEWYAAQKILLRLRTPAAAIRPSAHQVVLPSGEQLIYDRLLLATGARPFIPPVPGVEKKGVFALRTLADADAIRSHAGGSRRAVVLGGGLLGLETARALASTGLEVTVIEVAPYLLPRQMDREGAQVLQKRLEGMGLRFRTDSQPAEIEGEGSVAGVRLKDGSKVACELALFSTGIVPRIELAEDAGLATDRGITVDEYLQTGAEDVFAAGDAAEFNFCVYGLIPPAIEQARAAAENMAGGRKTAYRGTLTAATLKIAGMDLTSLGEATAEGGDLVILRRRGEVAGKYARLVLRNGVVTGAVLLEEKQLAAPVRQLISSRTNVAAWQDRLLDPMFDLQALAKSVAPAGSK
jgi:nitrite reductase (NADH) large subunit